jgi:pimeloyl-ACP methyl ester carboxylesterase
MATFALIHGASSAGFYWDRVRPRLEAEGHVVIAPDLPAADSNADFDDYADAVDDALDRVESSGNLIVVGQSMGGFTAPVVASRHPGARLVLIAPMIPLPGETPGDYFQAVDLDAAQKAAAEAGGYDPAFDVRRTFLHDVPSGVVDDLMARGEPEQAETIFSKPFPLTSWPDVETRVIACTADRMFPLSLVQRVAHDRLGVEAEHLDSGHLPGFGHPHQLAELLLR